MRTLTKKHTHTHTQTLEIVYICSSWVEEFVGNPNHGHVALIDLIKDLADHPNSVPRKNPKKYTVLNREAVSRAEIVWTFNLPTSFLLELPS